MSTPNPLETAAKADIAKAKSWWAKYGRYLIWALIVGASVWFGHHLK